jgi:hypothetical protein
MPKKSTTRNEILFLKNLSILFLFLTAIEEKEQNPDPGGPRINEMLRIRI